MAEKGYNLKTIMELRMDPEGNWMQDLPKRMFRNDAIWFISHAQSMYMAVCTPSDPNDKFILTDDSYNVFEGPNYFAADEGTGKIQGTAYATLHEFAPISPKLMIVLRSFVIQVAEENSNADVQLERELCRSLTLDMVYEREVKSLLEDLPIKKASKNHSETVNGRVQLFNGEEG
jgi:hypothetical protein